ncbi:MAG: amidohydrolase family protein [Deltaproteobacteria bacterium]|nr:amidohydrolase family protein [Deltaproteobacteria bacterium]
MPGADAGRAEEPPKLVLRVARLLVPKTGAVVQPAFVTVEGDKLARVENTPPEGGVAVTDLGDTTLTPGLVDAHTHLLHEENPAEEGSMIAEAASQSDAERALRGARYAREMLRAGFTTVRDLGNSGHGADVAMKRAIAKGWVDGPRMFVSARALAPPGGQFTRLEPQFLGLVDREYAVVRTVDDARSLVAQTFYEGADLIKVIVDHGPGRVLAQGELDAIVEAAHRANRKVAAHALTEEACAAAARAGVDSIDHGYQVTDATLGEMAKKKIFLVPTDYPLDFYEAFSPAGPNRAKVLEGMKKFREGQIDRMTRARKLHVRIVAGSDAYVVTPRADRGREAALMFSAYADAGMTPLEILQSATSEAADLLGLPPSAMAMTAGAPADLVAWRGDPKEDPKVLAGARPAFVMKGGKIVHRDVPDR